MPTFETITDAQANANIAGRLPSFPNEYETYRVWPKMLDVVRAVAQEQESPYKMNCLAQFGGQDNANSELEYLWYAATQKLHAEQQEAQDAEMAQFGWKPITRETADAIPSSGRIELCLDAKSPERIALCRIAKARDGMPLFIPPRHSRRGYSLMSLAIGEHRVYYRIIQ